MISEIQTSLDEIYSAEERKETIPEVRYRDGHV